MKGDRYQRVRNLFHAACDLNEDDRAELLEEACGSDASLRAEVEALLTGDVDQTDVFAESNLGSVRQVLEQALVDSGASFSETSREARFLPGHMVAQRYRIVSLLGRGGMGEVYRADDLKLGHAVALKFLPSDLSNDVRRREYFLNEVRLSRQIAHPNVCRVYDIGEFDGSYFLSMEYIDGEDLQSLLRRIGRLPSAKGIDIARQLCLGLAAAHDRGVLHRDLKPANVMIDGRGQVRITDFGLARLAADAGDVREFAGTPAYMAPEQLARGEITGSSDIYSLGLILYELFTGEAVHSTESAAPFRQEDSGAPPKLPSSLIDDCDPAVEHIVMACLQHDVAERPRSAYVVAAALPGANSLDIAIAAGETPSPDAVAAANRPRSLPRALGVATVVGVLVGIACIVLLSRVSQQRIGFVAQDLNRSAEARQLVRSLGYDEGLTDSAWGLQWNKPFFDYFERNDDATRQWEALTGTPPTAASFWWRESVSDLVPQQGRGPFSAMFVMRDDPSPFVPGMVSLVLDANGKLLELVAVPTSQGQSPLESDVDPSAWRQPLLAAAGIDVSVLEDRFELQADSKSFQPPTIFADTWQSWKSRSSDIIVQAAAYRERPVFFRVGPVGAEEASSPPRVFETTFVVALLTVFITAIVLARRNWLAGRADRRGAAKMFVGILALSLGYWALQAHHVLSSGELAMILQTSARALLRAVLICAAYIGLEPYVRKWRPHALIGWARLLKGQVRDAVVGQDILAGVASGVLAQLIGSAGLVVGFPRQIALLAEPILNVGSGPFDLRPLMGPHAALGQICAVLFLALVGGFVACPLFFFVLRVVLRKTWAASIAFVLFYSLPSFVRGDVHGAVTVAIWAAFGLFLLFRFGVLTVAVAWLTWQLLAWPVAFNFAAPHVDIGLMAHLLVTGLACYGAFTAVSPTPLARRTQNTRKFVAC